MRYPLHTHGQSFKCETASSIDYERAPSDKSGYAGERIDPSLTKPLSSLAPSFASSNRMLGIGAMLCVRVTRIVTVDVQQPPGLRALHASPRQARALQQVCAEWTSGPRYFVEALDAKRGYECNPYVTS